MLYSFKPIADEKSKVLILGTMPGVKSLEKHQYYGHQRNHFWEIIYALFEKSADPNYERRKQFLLDNGIALWDVIKCCERKGSLDSNIRNAEPNDIMGLLDSYPGIGAICFNGYKAYELFRKMIPGGRELNMKQYKLPSTSPARTLSFEKKLSNWVKVRRSVEEFQDGE